MVRVGKPETVLVELEKAIGANYVYAHIEVSHDEVKAEEKIEAAMKEENVEMKYFWGSTLYHVDDLPFKLDGMPSNYGGFRD
ncbi:Rossmann-like alpha/beta/alpha sandwich fold [Sesbania bispinosa]|nr:Rossmann-like alpha/beta/alpha sandwich fold [Sesbania bispinosa]